MVTAAVCYFIPMLINPNEEINYEQHKLFYIFAVFCLLCMIIFVLCYILVVETKGKDEEDLVEEYSSITICCQKPSVRKLREDMQFMKYYESSSE